MKVTVKSSQCLGLVIKSFSYEGEVVRFTKTTARVTVNGQEKVFRFVKVLSNGKSFYKEGTGLYFEVQR